MFSMRKHVLLASSLLYDFLSTGPITIGWSSLLYIIMRKNNIQLTTDIYVEITALFSVMIFSSTTSSLCSGILNDKFGPRPLSALGTICIVTGSLMLGFIETQNLRFFIPAIILMGLAGPANHMASMTYANIFPEKKILLVGIYTGLWTAGGYIYSTFQVVYDLVDIRWLFLSHALAVCILGISNQFTIHHYAIKRQGKLFVIPKDWRIYGLLIFFSIDMLAAAFFMATINLQLNNHPDENLLIILFTFIHASGFLAALLISAIIIKGGEIGIKVGIWMVGINGFVWNFLYIFQNNTVAYYIVVFILFSFHKASFFSLVFILVKKWYPNNFGVIAGSINFIGILFSLIQIAFVEIARVYLNNSYTYIHILLGGLLFLDLIYPLTYTIKK